MSQTNCRKPKCLSEPKNSYPLKEIIQNQVSSSKGDSHSSGSFLKDLRLAKSLSQRALAKKLGIPRTNLQRLEETPLQMLPLGILEQFSNGIGVKMEDLLHSFNGFGKEGLMRSNLKNPFFSFQYKEGVEFASFLKTPEACFIGSLTLKPQKTLLKEEAPHGKFLFYLVLEGMVLATVSSKECLFKAGEFFTMDESSPYELYNPHQFEKLVALLFCFPSFICRKS